MAGGARDEEAAVKGEDLKLVVRRYYDEVFVHRNPTALDELFAPDFVGHSAAVGDYDLGPMGLWVVGRLLQDHQHIGPAAHQGGGNLQHLLSANHPLEPTKQGRGIRRSATSSSSGSGDALVRRMVRDCSHIPRRVHERDGKRMRSPTYQTSYSSVGSVGVLVRVVEP